MKRRDRGDYARVLLTFAREAADARAHPAFRAPSWFGGDDVIYTSGAFAPREQSRLCAF
ncbi:MAG: hypothetical protein HY242_09975 [Afipia sp.]|nr:hypothetical protein [Afipia sp.]